MLNLFGLVLLFFLPIVESYSREAAFYMLLAGSCAIGFRYFWSGKIKTDAVNILWILMLIVFSISTVLSIDFYRSFFEFLRYTSYFLAFAGLREMENPQKILKYFYMPMIVVNSFILLILSVLYAIPQFHLTPFHTMTLFYPAFGHNHLSDILVFAIPLSIAKFIDSHQNRKKWLWLSASSFFLLFFAYSLGRAATIALGLSFFLYIIFIDKRGVWYFWGLIAGILSIIMLMLIFYISNINGPIRSDNLMVMKLYKPFIYDVHIMNDYQAVKAGLESPLYGKGLNTFKIAAGLIPPLNRNWYAHNQYLEILSDTGIFGAITFIIFIIVIFYKSFYVFVGKETAKKSHDNSGGLFILLLASAIQSFFDYNWHFISIYFLFFAGIALLNHDEKFSGKNKLLWKLFFIVILVLFVSVFKSGVRNLN